MKKISTHHVSKKFKIGFKKRQSVLAHLATFLAGREQKREIVALDDISLDVDAGEILGLIGDNASGKSTLLRIIAGIYTQDTGDLITHGKIISIINLGIALKERLTMKENVYLVGSLFGVSQQQLHARFDSIVDFSELNPFIDTKIYQFSAGMLQRLAFSIAIHSDPEILLLDEVFEVGDEHFRKKSSEKIKKLVAGGVAVIFVTHDLEMIRRQCHRVVWLSNGKIKMIGAPDEIVRHYVQ